MAQILMIKWLVVTKNEQDYIHEYVGASNVADGVYGPVPKDQDAEALIFERRQFYLDMLRAVAKTTARGWR